MLGQDLLAACSHAGIEVWGADLPELDITNPEQLLSDVPAGDWVVNCAAYTRVDDAEKETDLAHAINGDGALNVARFCHERHVPLLHISTDYVFDGAKRRAMTEQDRPNPVNAYGASKLAGENFIRGVGCSYLIVRTQSLFGVHGHNFIKAITRKLAAGDEPLRVVNDQVSAPTYTAHLARALIQLMQRNREGIVHVTASGHCSWYDFALAIARHVKPDARIEPISTRESGRPAPRPAYSVLDNSRYIEWTGQAMPAWQDGLKEYMQEAAKHA